MLASCGGHVAPAYADGEEAPRPAGVAVVRLGPGIFRPDAPIVEIGKGGRLCGPLQIKDANGLLVVEVAAGACKER